MGARAAVAVLVGGTLLLSLACTGGRKVGMVPVDPRLNVGIYKAYVEDDSGKKRRFRLMLFAALPDRLHGEVVSPLGSTELIVDAGDGRISIAQMRQRTAYVGPADSDALGRLLGIQLGVKELVRVLLLGEIPEGETSVRRTPAQGPGLPRELEIRSPTGQLVLQLKRVQPLKHGSSELGRGTVPDGFSRRELSELGADVLPTWDADRTEP